MSVKIEGHSNLVRDNVSGLVMDNNISEYEAFCHASNERKRTETRLDSLEKKIDKLVSLLDKISV